MGHPLAGMGTPWPDQDGVPPPQLGTGYKPLSPGISYAWESYPAGGTPLAVSRRRTFLCKYVVIGTVKIRVRDIVATVADPGFPRGGAPTYYLTNFPQKLHENENRRGGGGGVPCAPT